MLKNILGAIFMACAIALAGCGGGGTSGTSGGTGGTGGTSGTGTLRVSLVDAASPEILAANVTITGIDANVNGGWTTISDEDREVDLLTLRDQDLLLGSVALPAGTYNQVRLRVSNATVTTAEGTFPVTIPSAEQTGIKINLNYTINPNTVTEILLDFNVGKSFLRQGNGTWRMQPVIPAVIRTLSGTITGLATSAGGNLNGATVTATYTAGESYPVGTEVNSTTTMNDGGFRLWALLPGTYTLTFSYTDANNVTQTATVENVVVTANQATDVGTVTLQ